MNRLINIPIAVVLSSVIAQAASITLAWDPSPDAASVSGYKLYQGNSSGIYSTTYEVGNETQVTVPALQEGATYYFAVTAVGTNLLESDFSNEVSTQVPHFPPDGPKNLMILKIEK